MELKTLFMSNKSCKTDSIDGEIATMKPFLIWRDDWLLGFDNLDDQHLELVDALNKLYQYIAEKEEKRLIPDIDIVCAQLSTLGYKARKHFQYEESLMQEYGYPQLADHHREHIMLLAELKVCIREIESGSKPFTLKTLTALKHWQIDHLLDSDRLLADYLKCQTQLLRDHTYGSKALEKRMTSNRHVILEIDP
jgi:hemerythrin